MSATSLSLSLFACAQGIRPEGIVTSAGANGDEAEDAPLDTPPSTPARSAREQAAVRPVESASDVAVLELAGVRRRGEGAVRVTGKLEGAKLPATFRLRTEDGCPRDVTLPTTTTGTAFAFEVARTELAEAFGCAIDVDAGRDLTATLIVSPGASVSASTTSDADELDIGGFELVGVDPEARTGTLVRFAVSPRSRDEVFDAAWVSLAGKTYQGTGSGSDMAFFDVPATTWAAAVADGAPATIHARLRSGQERSLTLAPEANIELLGEDGELGDFGELGDLE